MQAQIVIDYSGNKLNLRVTGTNDQLAVSILEMAKELLLRRLISSDKVKRIQDSDLMEQVAKIVPGRRVDQVG